MTDLEMTRLCARAMGYTRFQEYGDESKPCCYEGDKRIWYWPLTDGAQAIELVDRFNLCLQPPGAGDSTWHAWLYEKPNRTGISSDINRAIVTCVAKMQASK